MHYQSKPGVEAALVTVQNNRRTYSVAEVAEMYGVHASTIYREVKAGRIRALGIGAKRGRVRIPVAALAEYEALAALTFDGLEGVAA